MDKKTQIFSPKDGLKKKPESPDSIRSRNILQKQVQKNVDKQIIIMLKYKIKLKRQGVIGWAV